MKLRYHIHDVAADPKRVTRSDWRLARTAFLQSAVVGVTPIQAARVLDVSLALRLCMESLIAKTPSQLAALVCGLLAERRIPKRRKSGAK